MDEYDMTIKTLRTVQEVFALLIKAYELDFDVDAIDVAIEALKEKQERDNGCIYKFDRDTESWECSECGTLWTLMCGTPEENDMRYCTGCGRKLREESK